MTTLNLPARRGTELSRQRYLSFRVIPGGLGFDQVSTRTFLAATNNGANDRTCSTVLNFAGHFLVAGYTEVRVSSRVTCHYQGYCLYSDAHAFGNVSSVCDLLIRSRLACC